MKCKNCGAEITPETLFCYNCGTKVEADMPATTDMVPAPEQTTESAAENTTEPSVEPATENTKEPSLESAAELSAEPVQQPEEVMPIQPVFMQLDPATKAAQEKAAQEMAAAMGNAVASKNAEGTVVKKAKKKSGIVSIIKKYTVLLIVAAAVAVVAIVVLSNLKYITNAVMKMGKPDKYFKWVAEKTAAENNGNFADIYDEYLEILNFSDEKVDGSISLELYEGADKYLKQLKKLGADVTWLDSFDINYSADIKDDVFDLGTDVTVNGVEKMMDADLIFEADNDCAYLSLPSLSSNYMSWETDDMTEITDILDEYESLTAAMPGGRLVETLMNRYEYAAISVITSDNVKMTKGKTIRAEGLSQSVTELTVTIDNELCQNMLLAVVQEAKEDDDLQSVYEDFVEGTKDTEIGEEIGTDDWDYDDFLDELDEIEDEIDEYEPLSVYDYEREKYIDEEAELKLFVNAKGEIVGIAFTYESSVNFYDDINIEMYKVKQGSNVAYSIEVYDLEISAIGKETKGKFTGDADIEYDGIDIASAEIEKFDTEGCRKGKPSGKITISPEEDLFEYYFASYISNIDVSLVLDFDTEIKNGKVSIGVIYDEEDIAKLTIDYRISDGTVVKVPSGKNVIELEDEDDAEEYFDSVELDGLIKKMEKAGVPDDYIEYVEDIDDFDDLMELFDY